MRAARARTGAIGARATRRASSTRARRDAARVGASAASKSSSPSSERDDIGADGAGVELVLAEPLDGVIVVDTSNLNSNRFAALAQDYSIDLEILTKMMKLARQIGSRGREGHAVGALFALGALPALRKHTTALVLNPFKGHAAEKRSILDEANHETLAEFAWLDGAILFNREGIASDAGRYIQVPAGITPKPGEGGRHLAARAISQLVDGIAVCVSSSGTITVYANGRNRYRVKLN